MTQNHRDPAVLVELIRKTVDSIMRRAVRSDAQFLVQPVLDAYDTGDPVRLRRAANDFLEITEPDPPRENAYNNLLDWRDQPPDASAILMPARWVTDLGQARLDRAFRAHDWDAMESILVIDVFPRLRVLVRRLRDALDAQ